jgi:hypothetical protein
VKRDDGVIGGGGANVNQGQDEADGRDEGQSVERQVESWMHLEVYQLQFNGVR